MSLRGLPSTRPARIVGALTVLAAGTLVTGALTLAPSAQAATGCAVAYQPNQWTGGFTASIKVTAGDAALNGWTLTWTYTGDQKISSAWSAQVSTAGSVITATNAAWNGQVPAGGSVEFGVQGTFTTANPTPTDFTLNGVRCNNPTPATQTTAASASPSVTASASRSASASPSASASVSTSASASTSPSSGGGSGCATARLCDGFENQTGTTPSGGWTVTYPSCSGTGSASVDSTVAHSGSKSIRVNGGGGYCNHVFIKASTDLSAAGTVWYGRMYVRHTTALPPSHVTYLAMKDTADAGKDLRMGGQNQAMQWNRESDDATLPEQSPTGVALSVPLPTNQWNCVEFLVDGTGTLRTWLGGTAIPGLVVDGVPTADIDRQWLSRVWHPALADLKLGWESYGADTDTLWFDDVAVGSSRIGC